ncbi:aminoglycoside phosphotransferase family protein [Streptomyces armeniacus]|uniref:Aminoglycoside phosphotransferase family protein n=1 Tax=Streptomyces armeniacus TaxID=83291 RepID=A0A345XL29_9ACTN|nr:phosphotransferase [Streptomyces armeniacus]AXK32345.1 aminoglycoside phosphotransferase family protein [Streptomyces armeniacus]
MQQEAATDTSALAESLRGLVRAGAGQGRAPDEPVVLADRADGTVVRLGSAVAKAHAADADAAGLELRLRIAADPGLAGILLPPLPPGTVSRLADGRPATLWPYGTPVDPEAPDAAPWEEAGTLLARLHAVRPDGLRRRLGCGPLPAMRGPAKAARALDRMRTALAAPLADATTGAHAAPAHAAATVIERVWAGLPAWCRADEGAVPPRTDALCHGDFHLGQLVRHPAPGGPWQLIDVDDLGAGDPVWDLARPAAWYAAGLLPPAAWQRLLHAYEHASAASGGASRDAWPYGDPWRQLDAPARALTAQTAAVAVAKSVTERRPLDEDEEALVSACERIAAMPNYGQAGRRSVDPPANRTPRR